MEKTLMLTEKQQKVLKELEELLEFGFTKISGIEVHLLKMRLKKGLVYFMTGAVHSYSDAILRLIREGKTAAANVILRSLIESYINLNYILLGRSELNALRFIIEDSVNRRKLGKDIKSFLEKNPSFETSMGRVMDDPKAWDRFIKERQDEIDFVKRKRKLKRLRNLPDLKQRAIEVDKVVGKPTLEWWYLTIYWLFSHYSHLKARGLNAFLVKRRDASGYLFNLNGNLEDIEKIVVTTYAIYISFLMEMSKRFGVPTAVELKPYKQIFKSYSRRNN